MRSPRSILVAVGLVGACGSVNNSNDPADAPPTPDASTALDVTTVLAETPIANVDVVVIAPDNTVRAQAKTGADGTAHFDLVVAGDSVTVIYPTDANQSNRITTMLGIEPGDKLTFGTARFVSDGSQGMPTFTWPADANVGSWNIITACGVAFGNANDTSKVASLMNCPATFTAYIQGLSGNRVTSWSVLENVSASDGTIAFTNMRTPATFTINAEVPDGVNSYQLDGKTANGGTVGSPFVHLFGSQPGAIGGNFGRASAETEITWNTDHADPELGIQAGADRVGADVAVYQSALAPLPWVRAATVDTATRHLAWTQTDGGAYDLARVDSGWGANGENFTWSVVVPPGTTEFDFPVLPASVGVELPAAFNFSGVVLLQDLDVEDSYRAARNQPEWAIQPLNSTGADRRMIQSRGL